MDRYITTAIPYVNGAPHLGHALEVVQADVLARRWRQAGFEVRLLSGTDDYAITNVLAAEEARQPIEEFIAVRSAEFEQIAKTLNVQLDDYIKTSNDPRHRPGVERLWKAVEASGDLYRQAYVGLYCPRCEAFYEPANLDEGRCPDHKLPLDEVAEENWFFRLSRYRDQLLDAIETETVRIRPEARRNEVLGLLRSGLHDISVSRSNDRARGWGIPVPGDPSQVIYVWFDALGNYITALDYGSESPAYHRWWKDSERRVHVIGKGILRFHAVYWPAFLLSAGEELPTDILVHDYVRTESAAMSKTRGNVVDPIDLTQRYGATTVRWWCTSEVKHLGETEFTEQGLVTAANRDLAGGIGNLVSRIGGLRADSNGDERHLDLGELTPAVISARTTFDDRIEDLDLRGAADSVRQLVSDINRYLEEHRPWEGRATSAVVDTATNTTLELIELLEPVLPGLAKDARAQLVGERHGPLFSRVG